MKEEIDEALAEWDASGHKTSKGGKQIEDLAQRIREESSMSIRPSNATSSMPIVPVPAMTNSSELPLVRSRSFRNVWLILATLIALVGVGLAVALLPMMRPSVVPVVTTTQPAIKTDPPTLSTVQAEERGISKNTIKLGMSGPFSGPQRDMGDRIKLGLDIAIASINDEGGIFGRKLELVALDDGYTPDRAIANVKNLINEKKVFAILGSVGTPTSIAALPFAMENSTIFFGAMTGSDALRKDPPYRFVFHYRPSYGQEATRIVDYLINVLHLSESSIVVFAQNDSFGEAGYVGIQQQLRRLAKYDNVFRVKYDRNSTDVGPATRELLDYHNARNVDKTLRHPVKAIVIVGTYKPAANFIQNIRDRGLEAEFYNLSFVEGDSLAEALLERGKRYCRGVTVMQVVPTPTSPVTEAIYYRNVLAKYRPDQKPGLTSFEGFTVMRLFAEGIRRAGEHPTTEGVVDSLESINGITNITGVPLTMSHTMHQASNKVWASKLDQECKFEETGLDR